MPKLGLTMTEGVIAEWKKKVGDSIEKGEIIYSVETDKLTNDVEADCSGVLLKILVEAGQTVPCKAVVGYVGAAGEAVPDGPAAAEKPAAQAAEAAPAPAAAAAAEKNSVLVIGGGPGGYVAAIRCAQLGAKVTLIERDNLGGTCLNRGCMPTKARLHTSEIYHESLNNEDIGISCENVKVDWEKVQAFRASIVDRLTSGVKGLVRKNKIKLVSGTAVFTGAKTVSVDGTEYSAEKVIIASGSYPIIPGIPGLKESKAMIDSTGCLELDHIPESLLIIGGGVIGLELGSVYMRYGTKVTLVEMMPGLLPLMDGELSGMLKTKLEGQGMRIMTSSTVASVKDT